MPTFVQLLESRRLLSVDLVPDPVAIGQTFIRDDGGAFRYPVLVRNIGTKSVPASVEVDIYFVLSLNNIMGDGDDIAVDSTFTDELIPAGGSTSFVARVDWWAGLPHKQYYLGVVVDPLNALGEKNRRNNTVISSTPIINIIDQEWDTSGGYLQGTSGNDVVRISQPDDDVFVTINGLTRAMAWNATVVEIDAGGGNDHIAADAEVLIDLRITGSGGNDTIIGGQGEDELSGANGKDRIYGMDGDDYLLGGAHNDTLDGGEGDNTLSGAGGSDRLYGTWGSNWLIGGAGNDLLYSRAEPGFFNGPDTVSGGAGHDRALVDDNDILASIEEFVG
jgi:Ca2+-binding RTX toxin-like protein